MKNLSPRQRLAKIAEIIEAVDHRAMAADGPVTPTRVEMSDGEMRDIYSLATGRDSHSGRAVVDSEALQ